MTTGKQLLESVGKDKLKDFTKNSISHNDKTNTDKLNLWVRQKYFDGSFVPKLLADDIMKMQSFFHDGQQLYAYHGGVYRPDGEAVVKGLTQKLLSNESRRNRKEETLDFINTATRLQENEKERINPDDGIVNVKNGLLDVETGELKPHTPKRLSTIQLPVTYDPEADCPRIKQFLNEVIPLDAVPTIQEFIGYCLTPDTRHHKALMFTGTGSNGKSTLIELIKALIGKTNMVSIPVQALSDSRWKRADLEGKLLNAFADLSHKALESSSYFKMIVSGEEIDAERKNKDPFYFRPFAKQIFSANELPGSYDTSEAYMRRWIIINFPHQFKPGKNADENLVDKLTTDIELSGLLNFALEGFRRLREQGKFTENESTRQALQAYKENIDNVARFMGEECTVHTKARCIKTQLFTAYENWCNETGAKALGRYKFYERVKRMENVNEERTKNERFFTGIALKSDEGEPIERNPVLEI